MNGLHQLTGPKLLIHEPKVRANIQRMAGKAFAAGVKFRPHFKTHQSTVVGDWFREVGIEAITVSSPDMALTFFRNGWRDITLAIPANPHAHGIYSEMAAEADLHLITDDVDVTRSLNERLTHPVQIWIEVDCGLHRSGIRWCDAEALKELARVIETCDKLQLRGLLAHHGRTYTAKSPQEVREIYAESVNLGQIARTRLQKEGFVEVDLSVGDTPGCSLADLGPVDEIRPGNFVYYDWMQVQLCSCEPDQVAAALACPILSVQAARGELIVHAGAAHLSRESLYDESKKLYWFGCVSELSEIDGWNLPLEHAWVKGLSQEHGVIASDNVEWLERKRVGDTLVIFPVHSCLTADCMGDAVEVIYPG